MQQNLVNFMPLNFPKTQPATPNLRMARWWHRHGLSMGWRLSWLRSKGCPIPARPAPLPLPWLCRGRESCHIDAQAFDAFLFSCSNFPPKRDPRTVGLKVWVCFPLTLKCELQEKIWKGNRKGRGEQRLKLILKKLDVIIKQNPSIIAAAIHPNAIFTVGEFGFVFISGFQLMDVL